VSWLFECLPRPDFSHHASRHVRGGSAPRLQIAYVGEDALSEVRPRVRPEKPAASVMPKGGVLPAAC